jgi:TM2 domain-containing membrane protein YozV
VSVVRTGTTAIIWTWIINRMVTWIMYRMPVWGIINRWYANINRRTIVRRYIVYRRIIYRTVIITQGKMYTWFKVPSVIRIEIKMTRMIIAVNINMTVDHDLIFINFLTRWLTLVTIFFLHRFYPGHPESGIATCQSKEQCEKNGALEYFFCKHCDTS